MTHRPGKEQMKKIIIPVLAGILLLAGIGFTYAFFTVSQKSDNPITVGYCDIRVNELGSIPADIPSGEAFTISDTVTVTNTGTTDCYIRAAIDFDSNYSEAASTVKGMDVKWIYDNGFYYYSDPLKANDTTAPLLTGIDVAALDEDIAAGYKVGIYFEAVDPGNSLSYQGAWQEFNN